MKYTLIKGPHGMQLDKEGKILWVPKAAQINYNDFEVSVTDGYGTDIQSGKIFINNPPSIISTPKPVGLTGHTWRYKLTTEDLNGDRVTYRAVRLPKFAKFDRRTAMIEWTPKKNQDGVNDFILMAVDEHGATTTHDFQVHVFYDPSAKQLVNSGWPLMRSFCMGCWSDELSDFRQKIFYGLTKQTFWLEKHFHSNCVDFRFFKLKIYFNQVFFSGN